MVHGSTSLVDARNDEVRDLLGVFVVVLAVLILALALVSLRSLGEENRQEDAVKQRQAACRKKNAARNQCINQYGNA